MNRKILIVTGALIAGIASPSFAGDNSSGNLIRATAGTTVSANHGRNQGALIAVADRHDHKHRGRDYRHDDRRHYDSRHRSYYHTDYRRYDRRYDHRRDDRHSYKHHDKHGQHRHDWRDDGWNRHHRH